MVWRAGRASGSQGPLRKESPSLFPCALGPQGFTMPRHLTPHMWVSHGSRAPSDKIAPAYFRHQSQVQLSPVLLTNML